MNKKRPASIDASLFQNNNQSTPHKVNSEVIPYLGREHIGIKSGLADVVIIQTHRHSAQLVISPHARFVTVAYRISSVRHERRIAQQEGRRTAGLVGREVVIAHQLELRFQRPGAQANASGNPNPSPQLDRFITLIFDLQRSRRTFLTVTIDFHSAVTRRQTWLDQQLWVDPVGVTANQIQAQQVAVVVSLGAGAGDVALAFVVVEAVSQAGVNEVVTLLKAAVQGECVAVDFGLVAALPLTSVLMKLYARPRVSWSLSLPSAPTAMPRL